MGTKLHVALLTLALPFSAGAIDRSHSFAVTQDSAKDAWVTTCGIQAKGVDASGAYRGYFQITYEDELGSSVLAYVPFELGPQARQFKEESPGLYKASGRLTKSGLSVGIEVTRYGPLTIYAYVTRLDETGRFGCIANIVEGYGSSYNVIHSVTGAQNVYFYRVGTGI